MSEELSKTPEISAKMEEELRAQLKEWEPELRKLLPSIAQNLKITFSNKWLIKDYGIGGFATDTDHIELAFDPSFSDKQAQLKNFKGSFFHEVYHTQQTGGGRYRGFTWYSYDPNNKRSALENAILEGAATKFEMLKTDSSPGWGEYPDDVETWVDEVAGLKEGFDEAKWKFYDPETDRRWIMYRSGSYIVDKVLENSGKAIEDLATLAPMEIYELADLKHTK